jgi:hypothetical protein
MATLPKFSRHKLRRPYTGGGARERNLYHHKSAGPRARWENPLEEDGEDADGVTHTAAATDAL